MWHIKNFERGYVYSELEDKPCFEFCNEFIDEEGNKIYVPDSLYKEFVKRFKIDN